MDKKLKNFEKRLTMIQETSDLGQYGVNNQNLVEEETSFSDSSFDDRD